MLLRLIEEDWPLDHVVFFDTGMEYQAIYNNMEKIKPLLKDKGIKFKILKPKDPFLYNMLERDINKRDGGIKTGGRGWCGGAIRWGTSEKLSKINAYYNELSRGYETIVNYVGIAADETERINRSRDELKVNIYPLIEWGMDEAACLQYCYDHGFNWLEDTGSGGVLNLRTYTRFSTEYLVGVAETKQKTNYTICIYIYQITGKNSKTYSAKSKRRTKITEPYSKSKKNSRRVKILRFS